MKVPPDPSAEGNEILGVFGPDGNENGGSEEILHSEKIGNERMKNKKIKENNEGNNIETNDENYS